MKWCLIESPSFDRHFMPAAREECVRRTSNARKIGRESQHPSKEWFREARVGSEPNVVYSTRTTSAEERRHGVGQGSTAARRDCRGGGDCRDEYGRDRPSGAAAGR